MATAINASPGTAVLLEGAAGGTLQAEEIRWRPVLGLPCDLTVELAVPSFRVANLLRLQVGSLLGTGWQVAKDVPFRVNGTLIGWSEFEVVGDRLAVRLTELA